MADALYHAWMSENGQKDMEDMAPEFFAGGTGYTGRNPSNDNAPMGASTRPTRNSRSSDSSFFGRSALNGAQAATTAPQMQKAARNDAICQIDWVQSGENNMQQGSTRQAGLTNTQSQLLTQFGVFNSISSEFSEQDSLEWAHIGLGIGAFGAGIGEYSNKIDGYWKGTNGKWYAINWGGNQYTGGKNMVINRAEMFEGFGRAIFGADLMVESIRAFQDYERGDYMGVAKSGVDITMAAVGFLGPVGFAGSTAYFVADQMGWSNAAESYRQAMNGYERYDEYAVEHHLPLMNGKM